MQITFDRIKGRYSRKKRLPIIQVYMNSTELAEKLGITVDYLTQKRFWGKTPLPYYKLNNRIMYKCEEVERFIAQMNKMTQEEKAK